MLRCRAGGDSGRGRTQPLRVRHRQSIRWRYRLPAAVSAHRILPAMVTRRHRPAAFGFVYASLFSLILASGLPAATWTKGEKHARLAAGDTVYTQVTVRDVTPKSVFILHSGGMASVPLARLTPAMQQHFGFVAEEAAAYSRELKEASAQRRREIELYRQEVQNDGIGAPTAAAAVISRGEARLGWPTGVSELRPEVDLRPQFREIGLYKKDQNRRKSCAVFSVVTAYEYTLAMQTRQPVDLSEEFLIWAVREYDDADAGFQRGFLLWDVIRRACANGLPSAEVYREFTGEAMDETMPEPVLHDAASRAGAEIRLCFPLKGKPAAMLAQVVNALNAGRPVVIGLGWPNDQALQNTHLLDRQKAVSGHAVTLVGYRAEGRDLRKLRFIFRNSWGPAWGQGGHGFMTSRFFIHNVFEGYTLEFPSG